MSNHQDKNTAYGLFSKSLWVQHKMKYSEEQIKEEIVEFNKSCSKWWYELPQQEQAKYQKIADKLNGTPSSDIHPCQKLPPSPINMAKVQKPSSASTSEKSINQDQINKHFPSGLTKMRDLGEESDDSSENLDVTEKVFATKSKIMRDQSEDESDSSDNLDTTEKVFSTKSKIKSSKKKTKDPNAPKKPLGPYLLFSIDERKNIKKELGNSLSVPEIGKELGRRWKDINPMAKQDYDQKYKISKEKYEQNLLEYKAKNKPKNKKTTKKVSTGYMFFSQQEREKIKIENPLWSISQIGKELGHRWSQIDAKSKQAFKEMAQKESQNINT